MSMANNAWGEGGSRKHRAMKTPTNQAPQLTEGQALKMAIQSFPYDDPRLQALLSMTSEDRDAGFEAARAAGLREAAKTAREWTFGTAPSTTHLSVARVNFARFADRLEELVGKKEA